MAEDWSCRRQTAIAWLSGTDSLVIWVTAIAWLSGRQTTIAWLFGRQVAINWLSGRQTAIDWSREAARLWVFTFMTGRPLCGTEILIVMTSCVTHQRLVRGMTSCVT